MMAAFISATSLSIACSCSLHPQLSSCWIKYIKKSLYNTLKGQVSNTSKQHVLHVASHNPLKQGSFLSGQTHKIGASGLRYKSRWLYWPFPRTVNSKTKRIIWKGGLNLLTTCSATERRVFSSVSVSNLVMTSLRRSHVLELGRSVFAGHMCIQNTKGRIEYTFYWPTLQTNCCYNVILVSWRNVRQLCIECLLHQYKDLTAHLIILFINCCGPFMSGEGSKPRYNNMLHCSG